MKQKKTRKKHSKMLCMGINVKTGQRGPSWMVPVSPASKKVTIQGKVEHFLNGIRGTTFGCGVSKCIGDPENKTRFPHPVLMLPFVEKTNLFIVDKVRGGQPVHAIEYRHYVGHLIDMNDSKACKAMIKEHPEQVERAFTLYPARPSRPGQVTPPKTSNKTGQNTVFALKGSIKRAVNAGYIPPETALALESMGIE